MRLHSTSSSSFVRLGWPSEQTNRFRAATNRFVVVVFFSSLGGCGGLVSDGRGRRGARCFQVERMGRRRRGCSGIFKSRSSLARSNSAASSLSLSPLAGCGDGIQTMMGRSWRPFVAGWFGGCIMVIKMIAHNWQSLCLKSSSVFHERKRRCSSSCVSIECKASQDVRSLDSRRENIALLRIRCFLFVPKRKEVNLLLPSNKLHIALVCRWQLREKEKRILLVNGC